MSLRLYGITQDSYATFGLALYTNTFSIFGGITNRVAIVIIAGHIVMLS